MELTPDQISAQRDIEIATFYELMPEFRAYDSTENATAIFNYLAENNLPVQSGSLMGAFIILRKSGKIAPVPIQEDPAVAKKRAAEAELRARLEEEQNSNRPLSHRSHQEMQYEAAEKEAARQEAAKKLKEALQKRRAVEPPPEPIYFEKGPNAGRQNHAATEAAMEAWKKRTGR
jgi:hypothetical protein